MEYQWSWIRMTKLILHIDETPEEVEEDKTDDGNVYARELPVPSMEGYPF